MSSLQERFLNVMCSKKLPVAIYLVNGIRLQGSINSYDQHVVSLKGPNPQIVYKQNICTILPLDEVSYEEFEA